MLKIIQPKEQYSYQERINLLMGMMRYFQKIPLTLEEQKTSTFILGTANHDDASFLSEGDLYGGALLYQRRTRDLPFSFQRLMTAFDQENVWVSTTSLLINPKQNLSSKNHKKDAFSEEKIDGCQLFYEELLKKLAIFGKQKGINFLYLTLCSPEYKYTKSKGLWPYVLEISPEHSSDGLFHGILPLSGTIEKSQRPQRELSIARPPLPLAA